MDYENFKVEFVDAVTKNLLARNMNTEDITVQPVEKMNENYDAMTVMTAGKDIGINLNLNRYFALYEKGTNFDEITEKATDTIIEGMDQLPVVNVSSLSDYHLMKDKLSMEVVSAETNSELLQKVPHKDIEDMAVVYRFILDSNDDNRSSVLVTNKLMKQYGVSNEELHADAMVNAAEIRPAVIKGMNEVMTEMMGEDFINMGLKVNPSEEVFFVATVADKFNGAGVIAYDNFMDQAAEKLGGDFFILPSSIHEVLLVKDNGELSFRELRTMVEEVNLTEVRPEEKLTDNVYHFDSKEHIFEIAEKFETRQNEKQYKHGDKLEERGSVSKKLQDKQKEVAAKTPSKNVIEKAKIEKGGEVI